MMKINLNLKSNYSLNSTGTVEEVLKEFNTFDIISIADHNSVKSCYELSNNSSLTFLFLFKLHIVILLFLHILINLSM